MRRLFLALLLLPLLLAGSRLEAALVESALTGRVVTGDAPAANVTVTVLSLARKTEWNVVTNDRGTYWLAPLPPGEYDITFARTGLVTLTRRGLVELGRVERVDALLEPSEDEDTVTSTTRSVHAGSNTAITTHFTGLELDRLPLRGSLEAASLAPVPRIAGGIVDGAKLAPIFLGDEVVDELTVIRGATPVEHSQDSLLLVRTRSGGDDLHLSLRGTWSDADRSGFLLESASGGRIVSDRLWFFAGGWGGEAPYAGHSDVRGVSLAVDARLTDAQRLEVRWLDSDGSGFGSSAASVRYAATTTARLLAHATAVRTKDVFAERDTLSGKLAYVVGSHVLAAGVDDVGDGEEAFFIGDRLSTGRWTVNAGARASRDDGSFAFAPRIAGSYDLLGNGRHSLSASFGEYETGGLRDESTNIFAAGYTLAIDQFASVRADYLRYDDGPLTGDSLQAEARMRLFDRIETGATYGYHDVSGEGVLRQNHQGAIWGGFQLPFGDYEAGFTLMERYESGWSTDAAVRLIVPFNRVTATFAADVVNAFDTQAQGGRAVRVWARLGL